MKIVLAPDSFKESMTASEAVAAMRAGVLSVLPDAACVGVPMADGGEGTVDAVVDALHGQRVDAEVTDALGRPILARYGYVQLRQLAVIETAAAAGLELIEPDERDVLRASTFGVGQLIRSALDRGAEEFLVGLGGSATNDGGTGMLTALGAAFLDADGNPLQPGGAALQRLARIDLSGLDARLRDVRIRVASDVTAPLLGPTGASAVFGPQKGATPADVELLEAALTRLAGVTAATLGDAEPQRRGAGAAGGAGFALAEFLGAVNRPGVDEVAETVGLERALRGADWVFTGEGSVDAQTVMGKTPFGVAQLALQVGARVVIFAGRVAPDASVLLDHGVQRLVAITAEATPLEQALREGAESLTRATAEVCRELVG
ncbi:glycerate kinase [Mycobacterium sp. IDR2000157661]|uniref:glycerate kinase n=1 Tax=Mycobacterium sp. IDR2000157661 TaxID=2867005 RepID=UPI001EEABD79|nr:glycerate kinase [Mycobacterium sp. IDR2000157661]ULE33086.1 glycerate kinase [Mycobacterium sp. IDR2000157661]